MTDAPRARPVTSEGLRRLDDMRLSDVLVRLGAVETALGVNNERIAGLTLRLDREVLRRVELSEVHHQEQDHRLDLIEDWKLTVQTEIRSTFRLFRVLATGLTLVACVLGSLWTLHLLGLVS